MFNEYLFGYVPDLHLMTEAEFQAYYHLNYSGEVGAEDLYRWCDGDRDGLLTVYEFKHCYCHPDEYVYVEPIHEVDECSGTAVELYDSFNGLDENEELSHQEFLEFYATYFQNAEISETLFEYCDYDYSTYLSAEEFSACYCTGFYEPIEVVDEVELCLATAGTEFALIDTAAVENVGLISKHEFGIFWNAIQCNSQSVDDLYHTYDADYDNLLNYDEFAVLFCANVKHMPPV